MSKVEKAAIAVYMEDWDGDPLTEWDDIALRDKARYRRRARAAISAHESALAEEGFVIVPRVPTKGMMRAGADAVDEFLHDETEAECWNAMLDAALSDNQSRMEQVPRKSASHRGCSGAGEGGNG